jgi:lipopolysaccharide/colanic/teichoic acid biosynthesis glycosyltransferase
MTHATRTDLLTVEPTHYVGRSNLTSRIVALALLVPAAPVIAILALLVRLTSRGRAFYSQERSGIGGKPFQIHKIRTMCRNAEAPGQAVWSTKGDSRVTLIGRALRFLHLDELPQLVNIARGEMAFIGPRPERPQFVDELADSIPGYVQRLQVLPGVTGLAQINLNPDESVECVRKKLILDCMYIAAASPGLDARILACTALRMVGIRHGIAARLMKVRFRFDDAGRLHHGDQVLDQSWWLQPAQSKRETRREPAPVLVAAAAGGRSDYDGYAESSPSLEIDRPQIQLAGPSARGAKVGVAVRPK